MRNMTLLPVTAFSFRDVVVVLFVVPSPDMNLLRHLSGVLAFACLPPSDASAPPFIIIHR